MTMIVIIMSILQHGNFRSIVISQSSTCNYVSFWQKLGHAFTFAIANVR